MTALRTIDGRYQTLELLGEGLSGEVFLVAAAGQRFALKLLKPMADRRIHENLLKAFKFEFAFLKDLRHPNVVRIHDFGFDAATERFYFTEEFLASRGAADYVVHADAEILGELFVQAIQGLQAIHRAKLRHGDLKASNLLVIEEEGRPLLKIIDLGLADPRFPFTAGTPSTMAPEQILREPVDERADLYSLGVVFYQLFSGKNPFARGDVESTYRAHLSLKPPPLSLANPSVPSYWNAIFQTLLEKNPARRYRDAGDLLAAIEFARPGQGRSHRPWRPERWFARADLIERSLSELGKILAAKAGKPRALLLSGEAGAGKSRLAQELKYRLQMDGVRVLPAFEAGAELWLLDEWPAEAKDQALLWDSLAAAKAAPLFATVEKSREPSLRQDLRARGFEVEAFEVPAFSPEELKAFLQELSGIAEIPEAFLQGLWSKTGGNPGLVVASLESFSRRQRLLDAQGRWNLVAFREGDLDFEEKDWNLEELDKALAALPSSENQARAALKLRRADERMAGGRDPEIEGAFAEAEAEIAALPAGAERLRLKAACEERRGVFELKRGRTQAAKLRFERASALLEESDVDPALWIRCRNYLAGLMAQEGLGREAVRLFREMEGKWSDLPDEQQARVLNQDLGSALLQVGEVQSAVAAWQRLLPVYERLGDPPSLMRACYNLAEAQMAARDFEAAVRGFERGAQWMRLHRQFDFLLRTYNGLGKAHHLMGQAEAAKNDYRTGLELAEYLGDACSAAALAQNLGSLLVEEGDFEAARRHFDLAINFLGKLPERHAYSQYLLARAWIELADLERRQGEYDRAAAFARDANRLAQQEASLAGFRFWVLLTQAEIARDRGPPAELQGILAELLPLADDAEKKAKVAEFQTPAPAPKSAAPEGATKVEKIPSSPLMGGQSLVLAERRLAEERDPETLRRLVSELERRLRESEEELERSRREGAESSVLLRFAEVDFLSRNKAMQDLFRSVERIRDTELAVLIHGESGTGKELLARSLHRGSRRHTGPFVAVNCAAFPAALIESELFGYKAGAFTGAIRDRVGLIESAEGGTLFLDEIAELEPPIQAKLLRVLQEREVVRLGETKPRPVRFRLLAASHRKLEAEVRAGRFREDLYYRVAELELELPPLRERPEDIAPLAERFIAQYLEEHREKETVKLGRDLLGALLEYSWPGNVRELENLMRVATALRRGGQLRLPDLPASWRERLKAKGRAANQGPSPTEADKAVPSPEAKSWRELEELILAKALLRFDLDVRQAAQALGCAPSKLYQRLRESRVSERRSHWEAAPYPYQGESLAELKRRAFGEALAEAGGSAYRAARRLGVSPATVYQWTR